MKYPDVNDEGMPVYNAIATVTRDGKLKIAVFLDTSGELASAGTLTCGSADAIARRMLQFQKVGSA